MYIYSLVQSGEQNVRAACYNAPGAPKPEEVYEEYPNKKRRFSLIFVRADRLMYLACHISEGRGISETLGSPHMKRLRQEVKPARGIICNAPGGPKLLLLYCCCTSTR